LKRKYKEYEKKVRKEFEAWLEKRHRDWSISEKPTKIERFPRIKISEEKILFEAYRLSPDIDVLAYCKASDKLIGYEIKKPQFRPKKYLIVRKGEEVEVLSAYWDRELLKYYKGLEGKKLGYEIEYPTQPHYPDLGIIYKGMGQALFNLRYVDQSFLVLPHFDYLSHHSHPIFLNNLLDRALPLGLIEYEYFFPSNDKLKIREFRIIREAKNSSLWRYYGQSLQSHKNQIDLLHECKIRDLLKEKLKKGQL